MKTGTTLKAIAALTVLALSAPVGAAQSATHASHRVGTPARHVAPRVPEPETWAMFGVSLTMLGALARRRLAKK